MVCPNCGATLPDTVSMCYSCRMVFKPNNQQNQNASQSKQMNHPAKQDINSKQNNTNERIKDIIIGLIVIAIAIFGLYMGSQYFNSVSLTP